jgi:hypothetical protein
LLLFDNFQLVICLIVSCLSWFSQDEEKELRPKTEEESKGLQMRVDSFSLTPIVKGR